MSDIIGTSLTNVASTAALALVQQRFATLPVANLGTTLYVLSLRAPGPSASPIPSLTFVFPLTPQQVRKEPVALNMPYDVQGDPGQGGVQRLVDMWGEAPPTYIISGHTGWKLHAMDGFRYNGKQAIQKLQELLSTFAQVNQQLMLDQATEFYTLEFYDYWMEEFWQVVPVGPQGIMQSADRPILSGYALRLMAIQAIDSPIPPLIVDLVENAFSIAAEAATTVIDNFLTSTLAKYPL
jgi:hypothetical protein